jgi:hypothetical protein
LVGFIFYKFVRNFTQIDPTPARVVRGSERVRALVEGPPDHLSALELQEELGLLRVRHHAHLHQAHLHLQPGAYPTQSYKYWFTNFWHLRIIHFCATFNQYCSLIRQVFCNHFEPISLRRHENSLLTYT